MSSAALPPWKAREEIRLRRIVIEEGEGAKMFDGVDMGRLIVDLFAVQCSSHILFASFNYSYPPGVDVNRDCCMTRE